MKSRVASTLILFGVLTAGCGEILGEDFKGYRLRCMSGSSSCAGGGAGVFGSRSESAGENAGGTAGKAAAAGHGGKNEPQCGGVKCGDLDAGRGGSTGSAGSAADAGSARNPGAAGSAVSAASAGSGGIGGSGGAGSGGVASSGSVGGSAGFGDAAGTGGNGGSFGGDSSAGVGNSSGSGGTAGSGGASGSSGTTCQPAIPECQPGDSPAMPTIQGIGMYSAEQSGGGFEVFATKRSSSTIANLWAITAEETTWAPWLCFNSLPQPDRLAANALLNGAKDVFATTLCGELYWRAFLYDEANYGTWHPWQLFSVPPLGSAVTDVAVTEGANGAEVVYVADAGRVFARPRVGTKQSAPFSDWFEITGVSNALLVTAGTRSDGRQQAFMIDADGLVQSAIQGTTDSTAPFGAWSDFNSSQLPRPVLDIEAPNGGPLPLEVFAVDANGALWQRAQNKTTGVWGSWDVWDGPIPPDKLKSLTGAGLKFSKNAVRITVLTQDGTAYSSKRTSGIWDDWRLFP